MKNKNYYDLTVNLDVRLSWSGTFIHSAPWSVAHQGVDNVSHGCINLSPARAALYFNFARYGDLVTVKNTIFNDVFDPPRSHREAELPDQAPITVAKLALEYHEQLIAEASAFG